MLFVNVFLLCACALQNKHCLSRHRKVRLAVKIGKFWTFDNIFFGELHPCNVLTKSQLQFGPVFYPILVHELDELEAFSGPNFRAQVWNKGCFGRATAGAVKNEPESEQNNNTGRSVKQFNIKHICPLILM